MSALKTKLASLQVMTPSQLRAEWREQLRTIAPDIGPDLLRRGIAWKLQSRVHGGLPTATRNRLSEALRQIEKTGDVTSARDISFKTGTRLVRQWHGKTHHVLVLGDGFEHQGRRYSSLTQIASAITGTHWSGPRFFGVRKRKSEKQRACADG
jgi:hypothetical protein